MPDPLSQRSLFWNGTKRTLEPPLNRKAFEREFRVDSQPANRRQSDDFDGFKSSPQSKFVPVHIAPEQRMSGRPDRWVATGFGLAE